MTCVAAVIDRDAGRVVMGADSAGVSGWELTQRADPKVFRHGDLLLGFTTSWRMGQLLRYQLPELDPPRRGLERWAVTVMVPAVRQALADGGWLETKHGRDEGGAFLVGVRDRLFCMHSDLQVAVPASGYDAVGCGGSTALGSLHSTRGQPADQRVGAALRAAEAHNIGVRGPFRVLAT